MFLRLKLKTNRAWVSNVLQQQLLLQYFMCLNYLYNQAGVKTYNTTAIQT